MEKPGQDHKRTVLIVDGSPTILLYHSVLMQRLRYAVLTAPDPEQALQLLEHTVPSIILTGLTFARTSGIDFIKQLKSNGRTKAVPVIVLTALEDKATRVDCLAAGCNAYLSKPVEPSCLFWTVQEVAEQIPRQFVRINTSIKTIADGKHEYATSLSEDGLYLRTLAPRQKNDLVSITMVVDGREIRTQASVLYRMDIGRGAFKEPGMGLKFVDISEDDRNFLRKFIRDRLIADVNLFTGIGAGGAAPMRDDEPKGRLAVLAGKASSMLKRLLGSSRGPGSKAA